MNCGRCQKAFRKDDLVMKTCKKIYHFDCFRCESCNCHLLPGDEFHLRDGHLFCTADHDVSETPTEERSQHNPENIPNTEAIGLEYIILIKPKEIHIFIINGNAV